MGSARLELSNVSLLALLAFTRASYDWKELNLLAEHVPMVFANNPWLRTACRQDPSCPHKDALRRTLCWGYEKDCSNRYLDDYPKCNSKADEGRYWLQGDYGHLRAHLDDMETRRICKPISLNSSSLVCTKEAKMCKAKNLFLHLPSLDSKDGNVLLVPREGTIGGFCDLNKEQLHQETAVKRSLSTWGFQLQSFKRLKFNPFGGAREKCDVIFDKPVVFVQLDAIGNLYHHFCDFFNLYLTQHSNNSWFGTDVQIIRWTDHFQFRDPFMDVWKVFTKNGVLSLRDLAWKNVCIPDATFSFLPRMSHGLYYSTYLDENCRGSRLMKSFSDHLLHRLGITDESAGKSNSIRVTFLQRGGKNNARTFRRVLNIDALEKRLSKIPNLKVQVVSYDFSEKSFLEQLQITKNTDIFIGMHGAGLAHFIFLPDWAIAFELYNCGDIRCYRDLARLRGLRYMTWEDASKVKEHDKGVHDRYGDNAKFWNYSFDVEEFIRLVRKARNILLEHERFSHLGKSQPKGGKSEL